jgi:hypothetical protein
MRKTKESDVLATRFVAGRTHPAIFGIFQSKTNWVALHPYDSSDSKIYDVGIQLRLRVLGMICAAFGSYTPGVVYQEEGAMEKTRKVSPVFETTTEEFGIAWNAKSAISGLLDGVDAVVRRGNMFSAICGPIAVKLIAECGDLDENVQLTMSALVSILLKDRHLLSDDEIEKILFQSFCLLDEGAFALIKELVPGYGTRKHGSPREIHITTLVLLTLETCVMVNQLCGNSLNIQLVCPNQHLHPAEQF